MIKKVRITFRFWDGMYRVNPEEQVVQRVEDGMVIDDVFDTAIENDLYIVRAQGGSTYKFPLSVIKIIEEKNIRRSIL